MFVLAGHSQVERPQDGLHLLGRGPPPTLAQLAYRVVQLLHGDRARSHVMGGATASIH
jgi:hypothetical protein